jgi:hypothetical protein
MFKYREKAKLYIITSVVLLLSILVYQGCQSVHSRISLLENKVKELEFIAFNK